MDQAKSTSGKSALTFALCFAGALVEGYDLQAAAVTMRKLVAAFSLTPQQTTWVPTANTLGLLIGAAFGGWLADRIGRKWVLALSMLAFGVFSLGTAFAPDAGTLILTRFLVGLGLGGAMPNIIALVAESGSQSGKNKVAKVAALTAGMPFGGFLSTVLALSLGADFHWQSLFYAGGLAPIVVGLVMIVLLPESPMFLAHRNTRLAVKDGSRRTPTSAVLFGEGRAIATLLLWGSFLFTLIVLYLMLNWLPVLMGQKGFKPLEAIWVASMFSLGGGIGAVVLGYFMRFGPKQILTLTYALMAVAVYALAQVGHDFTIALVAGFGVGFFVIGAQYLLYGLSPTFYPAAIRGTGVGWAVSIGRVGAVLGPYLAGRLLEGGRSATEIIMAILPAVLLAFVAALWLSFRPSAVDSLAPAAVEPAAA